MTAQPTEPEWRAKLDVALDAMMVGNTEVSEAIFDELDDELDGRFDPDWHFAVPYRGRAKRRDPAVEAKRVLAAICRWDGIGASWLAEWFDVSVTTVMTYFRRGERMLLRHRRGFSIGHPNGVFRTSYEIRWPAHRRSVGAEPEMPRLEEDWLSADERRERRRALIGAFGVDAVRVFGAQDVERR